MNKIKITDISNANRGSFEIPYQWLIKEGSSPNLNDLESSAERGKTTGYLFRNRVAEVPELVLSIFKQLKQKEIFPLLKVIRSTKATVYYFDEYVNSYVTREFYIPKPKLTVKQYSTDNNTDNIIYNAFDITFKGYGGIEE